MTIEKRSNLSRVIAYRPHVRWAYYIGWAITILAVVPLARTLSGPDIYMHYREALFLFTFFNLFGFAAFGFALYLIFHMAFKKFDVNPDHLKIMISGREETLNYADVIGVHFSYVPFLLKMFSVKTKTGKTYNFTHAIERSDYIIDSLYAYNPELFIQAELLEYRQAAILIDHSAHRFQRRAGNWKRLIFKYAFMPLLGACLIYWVDQKMGDHSARGLILSNFGLLFVAHVIAGAFIYFLSDWILLRREKKKLQEDPNNLRVDQAEEKQFEEKNQYAFAVLSLLIIGLAVLANMA